jgi:protoporphyrin/coproporphyrin ferrochelatase
MKKKGVLLVNLGSPDSASVADVRKYLREFLMDGRVIDAPWPIRFGIVHFSILPKRPHESAHAYQSIWLPEGSPLVLTSKKVQAKLQELVNVPVELAMRYQNPSIDDAIEKIAADGVEELLLIPLFPHYAMSSYETAVERVKEVIAANAPKIALQVMPPYYAEPGYIDALVASAATHLNEDYDHLLFSFHGVPERHLRKSDPTRSHCMKVRDCCSKPSPAHATCYRHQCFRTVQEFVKKAGVPGEKYSVAFQSRLGRDPWLQPYADAEIAQMPARGVKKLLVICPAFVSDCLETIEEIGMRGRETFLRAGGVELNLIPCLNDHPLWIRTLAAWVAGFVSKDQPEQMAPLLAS